MKTKTDNELTLKIDTGETFEVPFELLTHPKLNYADIGAIVQLMAAISEGAEAYDFIERDGGLSGNAKDLGIITATVEDGKLVVGIDLTKGRDQPPTP